MNDTRFSLEEFKTVFPGPYGSEAEMLREYQSFLRIVERAERSPGPALSARDRADIFRRSWPQRSESQPSIRALLAFWKRPAVTFAFGLLLGCVLMFGCMKARADLPQAPQAERVLTVESLGDTQTYQGKVLDGLYPRIENPRMVVEKSEGGPKPRRVLYGTLDDGEVYVVWNL